MKFGNILVGKRLFVGWGKPEALGKGEDEIRGSAYVEGSLQVGKDTDYSSVHATVMIGHESNEDTPSAPDKSLYVKGDTKIEGDGSYALTTVGNIYVDYGDIGDLQDRFNGADGRPKPFDMKHPTKEGHRLRYACIEGPEVGVYCRGRVNNGNNVIDLPHYWSGLVDYETITVQLTALGSHQNVIVKRISPIEQRIYLQAQGGMPVDCFYHIMAERKDVNKLIPEYEGESWKDYPDPNFNPEKVNYKDRTYNDPAFSGPPNTKTM